MVFATRALQTLALCALVLIGQTTEAHKLCPDGSGSSVTSQASLVSSASGSEGANASTTNSSAASTSSVTAVSNTSTSTSVSTQASGTASTASSASSVTQVSTTTTTSSSANASTSVTSNACSTAGTPLELSFALSTGSSHSVTLQPQVCYTFNNCAFASEIETLTLGAISSEANATLALFSGFSCTGSPATTVTPTEAGQTNAFPLTTFAFVVYESSTTVCSTIDACSI